MVCTFNVALAEWKIYKSSDYGFAMLVPEGTKMAGKDFGQGWGGLYCTVEGVELYGLAKLGTQATPEEIEKFAIEVSKIPADNWKLTDSGSGSSGWKWYRTYQATGGDNMVVAVLGTGPRGSYLLFLKTTVSDYNANKSDYMTWYNSLTLF